MKDTIIDSIGNVDDALIESVDIERNTKKKNFGWVKWASLAVAAGLVIFLGVRFVPALLDGGPSAPVSGGDAGYTVSELKIPVSLNAELSDAEVTIPAYERVNSDSPLERMKKLISAFHLNCDESQIVTNWQGKGSVYCHDDVYELEVNQKGMFFLNAYRGGSASSPVETTEAADSESENTYLTEAECRERALTLCKAVGLSVLEDRDYRFDTGNGLSTIFWIADFNDDFMNTYETGSVAVAFKGDRLNLMESYYELWEKRGTQTLISQKEAFARIPDTTVYTIPEADALVVTGCELVMIQGEPKWVFSLDGLGDWKISVDATKAK